MKKILKIIGMVAVFGAMFMATVHAVNGSFQLAGYSQSCNYSGFSINGSTLTVNVTNAECLDSQIVSSSGGSSSTGGGNTSSGSTGGTASCFAENGSVAHGSSVSSFSYKNVSGTRCNIASGVTCNNGDFSYVTVGGTLVGKEWINSATCGEGSGTSIGGGQHSQTTGCVLADGTTIAANTSSRFWDKDSCVRHSNLYRCAGNNILDSGDFSPAASDTSTKYYTSLASCNNAGSSTSSTSTGGGTSFGYSDIRLKKNITHVEDSLEKVAQLNGVNFNWKDTNKYDLGVIAQDVEKVSPEIVATMEDGYKSVDYPKLTALLIEAIKELKIQNEYLLEEITVLKNK